MIEIIIIAICLAGNAILSCIEMAFVTVSKPHIKQLAQKGSKSAYRLLKLKRNPERALSVLQIGITLLGAVSAAVSGAGAEEAIGPHFMNYFGMSEENAKFLAIAVIVVPLTYVSVVIGELVPKSIALRHPMKFALAGGWLLIVLDRIFAPFVFLLEISTKFLSQIFFNRLKSEGHIDTSREVDLDPLSESHKQYVFNLIDANKIPVKDIMIPWAEVATLDYSEHHFTVLEKIKTHRHTRFPVLKEGTVIGLLHSKEFVSEAEISKIDWTELIRTILTIGPNEPLLTALRKFQSNKGHMAIVMRDGNPLGVITVEDIFEEVVGEILDEDDDPKKLLSANSRIRVMNLNKKK